MLTPEARQEIQRLRAEIDDLRREPPLGDHWRRWYQQVCSLLKRVYGIESRELAEFQSIRFEASKMMYDAQETAQKLLQREVSILQDDYYQQRLSDASEYLLTLLVPIY